MSHIQEKVKFITEPHIQLRFDTDPNTICGLVLKSVHVPGSRPLEDWWGVVGSREVKVGISSHRNRAMKAMKERHFGECRRAVLHSRETNLTFLFQITEGKLEAAPVLRQQIT